MPEQNLPHSPEPFEEQPVEGQDPFEAQAYQDVVVEGRKQLAENLVKVAEAGDISTTREYLDTLLADTEKVVPAPERMAAFEFLAQEQRGEIRRGLYSACLNMVETFGMNNRDARQEIEQTAHRTRRGFDTATETFNYEVGRHFRGHVDARKASYGHEVAEQSLRKGFRLFGTHAEAVGGWIKKQKQTIGVYGEQVDSGRSHEIALDQASATLRPDYEGDPKDLSRAITEGVKSEVARKLKVAVDTAKKAGLPPEEAVLEIISAEAEPIDTKIIDGLRTEAEKFVDEISHKNNRVNLVKDDLMLAFRRFNQDGRDGYSYARRPEEAVDVYRRQKRKIEQIVEDITRATMLSGVLITASDDEHQRMQTISEVVSQQLAA